jgi:hypothetical protein
VRLLGAASRLPAHTLPAHSLMPGAAGHRLALRVRSTT